MTTSESEKERIEYVLNDWRHESDSVSMNIFQQIMWDALPHIEPTFTSVTKMCLAIERSMQDMIDHSNRWTSYGRYEQAKVIYHYLPVDTFGVYKTATDAMATLDRAYGENFSIESAKHVLADVAEWAMKFRTQELVEC